MPKYTNNAATKKDLNSLKTELKRDIKRLDTKIDTKVNQLDKKIDGVEKSLRAEIRISIQESEERTDERARQYRDEILTKMDRFLKEINDSREERIVVEKLETDVDKLKRRVVTS